MKNFKRKESLKETGITLLALAVTIIVLLILAGVTRTVALSNNGVMDRAQYASNTWANATKDEEAMMGELGQQIDDLSNVGSGGGSTGLSETQITAIENKIKEAATPIKVNYVPAANASASVVIPSDKNGGVTEQTFTQANLGTQSLEWYVLSADENGVNLVSQPTSNDKKIKFQDAGGYDNCLYYLNEISTKLFSNESLGVDSSKIHALNLSDIKKAAEKMNGNSYSWDTQMIQASDANAYNNGSVGTKTYTPSNKKYPQIYGTSTGAVNTNNPMYDENPGTANDLISGDLIGSTSKTASTLTVNYTNLPSVDNATTKTRLGDFGSSGIGGELFNSSGTNYWLASRCVYAGSGYADFSLRCVDSGCLRNGYLCSSDGGSYYPNYACRVVVSIPGSRVNATADGTVTLK